MKKLVTIVLLSSVASTSIFVGACVESHKVYDSASDQIEMTMHVGHNSDMGAGVVLTNTYTIQRKDELKHGYNEIEGWYPLFEPTDKLTTQPGGLIDGKSAGSGGATYLGVNYKSTPWFNLTVHNRYNHNNYSSTGLNDDQDSNGTCEIGNYWDFIITDKLSYTFEPHHFIQVNDLSNSNEKDHHQEITSTFKYRTNEHRSPHLELCWLDRSVEPYHHEQNQTRVGTRYFL